MGQRSRLVRVGPQFFQLHQEFKTNGLRVSSAEFSDGLAQFVKQENLTPMLLRRARGKQKGLFL